MFHHLKGIKSSRQKGPRLSEAYIRRRRFTPSADPDSSAPPKRVRAIDVFENLPDHLTSHQPMQQDSPDLHSLSINPFAPGNTVPPPPSAPLPNAVPRRAIDMFNLFPRDSPQQSAPLPANDPTPNAKPRRAIDMFDLFPSTDPLPPPPSAPSPNVKPPRAIDFLELFPSGSPTPILRPIAKLPRRFRHAPKTLDVDIDLTLPEPAFNADVLELTDSDDEQNPKPAKSTFPSSDFIYNTNDLLKTRQTTRTWEGSYFPESWIPSREELHSEQVDEDRALPAELCDDTFPSFVSSISLFFFVCLHPLQAISAGDMESLHRYLMSRYEVDDLQDYLQVLALFRNTRGIECKNAHSRWGELAEIARSLNTARYAILRKLQDRGLVPKEDAQSPL
jgi:hypothetical protein